MKCSVFASLGRTTGVCALVAIATLPWPGPARAADAGVPTADNLARAFFEAQGLVQLVLEPGGGANAATLEALAARMRGAGVSVATSAPPPGPPSDHYYLVSVRSLAGAAGASPRTSVRVFARDGSLLGVVSDGDPPLEYSVFPIRMRIRRPLAGRLDVIGPPATGRPQTRQALMVGGASAISVALVWGAAIEMSKLGFRPIRATQVGPAILASAGVATLLAGAAMRQ